MPGYFRKVVEEGDRAIDSLQFGCEFPGQRVNVWPQKHGQVIAWHSMNHQAVPGSSLPAIAWVFHRGCRATSGAEECQSPGIGLMFIVPDP